MKKSTDSPPKKLLCFSHLRWEPVFQRPQHLLSRFAKDMEVFYFEEPLFDAAEHNYLSVVKKEDQLSVLVPHLSAGLKIEEVTVAVQALLADFLEQEDLEDWLFWLCTPTAYPFCGNHKPKLIIYDCMDEFSASKLSSPTMVSLEKMLTSTADLIFTEGHSIYEAKKNHHQNIFPFPNSIDFSHFSKARNGPLITADAQGLHRPKIGFFGVIDERFDIELIRGIADLRPQWQIELIGPITKVDADLLPENENIHYLGEQPYEKLPMYMAGWDIGLIPFALNESTRFISPTKTSEYLAAGIPVVSTPIRDVIKPYGIARLVRICASAGNAVHAIEAELKNTNKEEWLVRVDDFLKDISWDNTYAEMRKHITATLQSNRDISIAS